MVLVDSEIRGLVEKRDLIENFDERLLEGASYDMRLGSQFVRNNETFSLEEGQSVVIEPGEFLLLTSLEMINLPLNYIGHNGIMSRWAKKGLVSLFSPQIDPGFKGLLIVPVFNAGGRSVSISLSDAFFTVEFVKCASDASYGWSEKHGIQSSILSPDGPHSVGPSLGTIKDIENSMKDTTQEILDIQQRLGNIEPHVDVFMKNKGFSLSRLAIFISILSVTISLIINHDKIIPYIQPLIE